VVASPGTVRRCCPIPGPAPWRSLFDVVGPSAARGADTVTVADRWAAAEAAIRTYPSWTVRERPSANSDIGFILLGMVAAWGAPLDILVRGTWPGPSDLPDYRPLDAGVPRSAIAPTSHDRLWRHRRSWGEVEDENATGLGGVAGHAGLFAAATDIAAFGQPDGCRRAGIDRRTGRGVRDPGQEGRPSRPGLRSARLRDGQASPVGCSAVGWARVRHTGFTGT
jgi:hypothetical protein